MNIQQNLIELSKRIRAISQNGLTYSHNEYDTERYGELQTISDTIISLVSGVEVSQITETFIVEDDYVTPKVDIRAVVFDEEKRILMVKESADNCWSLPGGWADVGFSPKEIAIKEVKEETGLDVAPLRLLAVMDKKCHNHPPALHYAYKIFILCKITGGTFTETFDILDKAFFDKDNLPELSTHRVTKEQIDLMFDYMEHPDKEAVVD